MKKYLFFCLLALFSFTNLRNINSQNKPEKWNLDPQQTAIFDANAISDAPPLPQTYEYVNQNSTTQYLRNPNGVFAVNPNVRVLPRTNSYQSEVIICRHPLNPLIMFGSSNAVNFVSGTVISEGVYVTTNGGVSWFGSDTLAGAPIGNHGGDPGPTIDKNGNFIMTHLGFSTSGMFANYSTNNGSTWSSTFTIATGSQDKNFATTDDAPSSAFYGRSYCVWSLFTAGSPPIAVSYTTNGGVSWSAAATINTSVSGHYSQGCDARVGPNGEVYVVWAAPNTSAGNVEDFAGFAKSINGGVTWTVTDNAYDMNGIRGTFPTKNNIRTNGFTRIDVDRSGGPRNGWIYVVSSEINLSPAGSDPDVVLHKSTNGGTSWSAGVRVNQDALNNGKYQWFPAIRVDESGGINIVYYDDRSTTSDSASVYLSRSIDGGVTWSDVKVSDHNSKPAPISGLATGYQGDYIGITSGNNKVWPLWADNSTGIYQAWTTSVDLGPGITHTALPNTEQLTGTYPVNCVITPSGSGINPSKTRLFWSRNNPLITDSVLMTNSSGTNWTANIPANGSAATYRYYIKTADSLNRTATAPAGAPAILNSFIASSDTARPVIAHTPLPDQAKPYWPSTVSATVTDNLGLDSVWVKWYKNSPVTTKQFKLINGGGSSFSAVFNSINSDVIIGDVISYKIFAQDNSLSHNRDSTALYTFNIIDVQLCEGFSSGTFPPAMWSVVFTGTNYWSSNSVSSYGIGTGSAKFDFWSASAGTIQSLVSLTFSSSVPGDSLRFDEAYAPYTSGTDSLIIETSTNAGSTFSTLVRLSGNASGGTLNTAPTSTSMFTPTSAQWATRRYSLPTGTNQIKFRASSGFGNNLYLDSICKVQGLPPPPPPVVNTSVDSIVVNLPVGSDSVNKILSIGNSGGSALNYNLTEVIASFAPTASKNNFTEEMIKEIMSQPKGAQDLYHGPDVTDGAGGPDAFGYVWIDSDEPGGPPFSWVDISGTGTPITTWTNGTGDDGSVVVPLPSAFSYYGSNYSQLKICTNGWVSFDVASLDVSYTETPIPAAAEPNNALLALWDDMDVRTSGSIYYYNDVVNNRFIVEYKDVPHYSAGGPYTFEIILYNDGRIYYQYLNLTAPLNSNTVGFENNTGTDGIQMVFDNTYIHNNLAIKIDKGGLPWVSENPLSGTVAAGSSQNVNVLFKSNSLSAGTYTGKLRVSSNDPSNPVKDVKLRLNIGLSVPSLITLTTEGFYNSSLNKLNIRDTVRIFLRNVSPPYNIVDSAKSVIDSLNLTGSFLFSLAPSGTYYLQVKSRNGLETWSKAGGESFTAGSVFSYNFTTASAQAYGNNMILKSTKYCLYSGDVNRDGLIDLTDIVSVFNDASTFLTGYLVTDLDGNRFVDLTDLTIGFNNSSNFVSKSVPPGAEPVNSKFTDKNPANIKSKTGKTNLTR